MAMLYPEIEPYQSGMLAVSEKHSIYYEQCGNPQGIPVVFLHGGPGGGGQTKYRRYFNPQVWRVILFDQRGCGRSVPFAELEDNHTWVLVADMEKLREHLNIGQWAVFGGSWGSALALTYGITHPASCLAFYLRGIFTLRRAELGWFYQGNAAQTEDSDRLGGAYWFYPEAWEDYLRLIPQDERGDMIAAYYRCLTGDDQALRLEAARSWSQWEARCSKLTVDKGMVERFGEEEFALAFARIECHYFINRGFFATDDWLLQNVSLPLRQVPCVIVQGHYDMVCPARTAWQLHRNWPEAHFHIIDAAGHSLEEPGITEKLLEYTDLGSEFFAGG